MLPEALPPPLPGARRQLMPKRRMRCNVPSEGDPVLNGGFCLDCPLPALQGPKPGLLPCSEKEDIRRGRTEDSPAFFEAHKGLPLREAAPRNTSPRSLG